MPTNEAHLVTARTMTVKVNVAKEAGQTDFDFDNVMEGTDIDDAIFMEQVCEDIKKRLTEGPLHGYYVEVSYS